MAAPDDWKDGPITLSPADRAALARPDPPRPLRERVRAAVRAAFAPRPPRRRTAAETRRSLERALGLRPRFGRDGAALAGTAAVIAALVGSALVYAVAYTASETTVPATVTRLERVAEPNGGGRYLVFTAEGEVFQVTDSTLYRRWDSSDRYGRLREGGAYTFRVAGWRWHFGSWYRNVLDADSAP